MKKILTLTVLFISAAYFIKPTTLKSDDLKKANKYYEKLDYHYAIEIYEKIMEKKPSLEVAQKLANCYKLVSNTQAAEQMYAKVFTFDGFDPALYLNYADILKQNANYLEAKKYYLLYASHFPEKANEATILANGCDAARLWAQNPVKTIEITNEASLNSSNSDFSPIVYENGYIIVSDRLFSEKKDKNKIYGWTGNPYLKLYTVEKTEGTEYKFNTLPKQINDGYHNGPAAISPDGKMMVFSRGGVIDKKNAKSNNVNVFRKTLYICNKENGEWSKEIPFPYNEVHKFSIQHPAFSADGNILYFSSDMAGGYGGMDLYYSVRTDDKWSKPVNLGPKINTKEDEVFPYIRHDGKLYFSSKAHITLGGLDIFEAVGEKENWSEPENLKAPFNSSKDDFGVLFFNDNKSGFISSNRAGGKGGDDIYRFNIKEPIVEKIFAVNGKVVEKGTTTPVANLKVYLVNKDTGKETTTFANESGFFKFDLEEGYDYIIRGDLDEFFARQEGNVSTKNVKESTVFNVNFEVEKAEDAFIVKLNNIYYDFDKFNIRPDAEPELQKVASFMSKTPNAKVELMSHTDARGKASYNMQLSQKRANSAKAYLLKQGANANKLSAKGYGETQLLNACSDGHKCTEEEHQLNRRTEFKVVKVEPTITYNNTPYVQNK